MQEIVFENVTGSAKTGLHGQNLDGTTLRNVAIDSLEGPPLHWINVRGREIQPAPTR